MNVIFCSHPLRFKYSYVLCTLFTSTLTLSSFQQSKKPEFTSTQTTGGVTVLHILMSTVLLVVAVLVVVAVVISGQYYIVAIYFTPDKDFE
jgi:hypothetical protein